MAADGTGPQQLTAFGRTTSGSSPRSQIVFGESDGGFTATVRASASTPTGHVQLRIDGADDGPAVMLRQ